MNLNKVFIIGNLTRDPELRMLPSGAPVVSFGVATNRIWKNQQGQKQEEVQFHNVVVFGRQAEIANQYLSKGRMVFIEGRIQTRDWEGKDGVKRSRTEIIAERVQFGPRPGGFNQKEEGAPKEQPSFKNELPEINIEEEEIKTEDLPF
ncbi:MAG: single-stranded DNA-binding protein [Patescibacteria group bacterium]